MALYIGVDPSLTKPGLAILEKDGSVVFCASLSVSQSKKGAERLAFIGTWILDVIKKCDDKIQRICIEGPSLNSTHREFDLGEASGTIKSFLYHYCSVEPLVLEPLRLKKFATNNAQASKEEVLHAVKNHLGLDLEDDDDAADACMLARFVWAIDHQTLLTRRCELEVVRDVTTPSKKKQRIRIPKRNNI